MIGMVNAIGAGQAARDQSARPTERARTQSEVGEPPMWIRPHEAKQGPTESAQAVRPTEFEQTQAQTEKPDGAQPQGASALGQFLDMIG
ncbi:MAG TPA: hypothetical protein P5572_11120 [Phycisphaerae bacterium]|nr:hypothetical protein [Phycisphaerae bacterium]